MFTHPNESKLIIRLKVRDDAQAQFSDWQAKLHGIVAKFHGFISLEILSPTQSLQPEWVLIFRFHNQDDLLSWRNSKERKHLSEELQPYLDLKAEQPIQESEQLIMDTKGGVTEVIVTKVKPEQLSAYRDWIGKIHQAEALFPGFQRVYVQAPDQENGESWITLLQFDTAENLENWLTSKERKEVLLEGQKLIHSLETHEVVSSFAGWFPPDRTGLKGFPPVWKQTMLVLLVLFPIVMLEMKFLPPLIGELNPSLKTFIGNAISVSLVSWPLMPIAIKLLGWWLIIPKSTNRLKIECSGLGVMAVLYLIEIIVFWNLL